MSVSQPEAQHFPCSLAQRRFWVLDQLDPGNPSLNVAVRWRLEGKVTHEHLQAAFQRILHRHEVLRTAFEAVDGDPRQRVEPVLNFQVPLIDLSGLPESQALAEATAVAQQEARTSFDLSSAPLIRVTHLRLSESAALILVTAHHSVCDGWSIGILAREMGALCLAQQTGTRARLPELPLQYGDFCRWQQAWLESGELESETRYWTGRLAGLRYFELPSDHPRPPVLTGNGQIVSRLLPRPLTERLAGHAREGGFTLYMTALAALLALLHRLSGQTDIAIGTQVTGREEVEIEPLVGVFINTLVLRNDLSGNPSFSELEARVRDSVLGAFEHQHMPLERLIEQLRPARDRSRNPLFSINFVYQRSFIENAAYGEFRLVDLPSHSAGSLYDLNMFMVERPEGWRLSCEFNTDLFEPATVEGYLDGLAQMFDTLVRDPSLRIGALPSASVARPEALYVKPGGDAGGQNLATAPRTEDPASWAVLPDPVEQRLAGLWSEVLGRTGVESESNFFELGGHSLLAVRLVARIHTHFGKRLSLAAFFEAPTLAAQAALLRETQDRAFDFRQVVKLQANGSRPPLIGLNNTGIFFTLARRLGGDQPFTSMQLFDPTGSPEQMPASLEALAARYVQLIRIAHPVGPYVLLGWCVAGALAFETARQMEASGLEVSQVILVDSWAPGHTRRLPALQAWLVDHVYRFKLIAQDWRRVRSQRLPLVEFLRHRVIYQRLMALLGRPLPPTLPAADFDSRRQSPEHYDQWLLASLTELARAYEPRAYGGKMLLFRSLEEPRGALLDRFLGWKPFVARGVEVVWVPGDHFTMFSDPGVQLMAERIRAGISGAPIADDTPPR